jgi:hypothetical protein
MPSNRPTGIRRLADAVLGPRQHDQDDVRCSLCGQPGKIVVVVTAPARWRPGTCDRAWHLQCWALRREPRHGATVSWLRAPFTGTWAELARLLPTAVHQVLVTRPRRWPLRSGRN